MQQPRRPADRARAPGPRRSGRPPRSSRRSPRRRPRCSRNLDTTFRALADVARPFLQDSISGGPPALDDGDRGASRSSGRSWPTATALFHDAAARASRRCRTAAPDLADAFDGRHAGAAALGRRSTSASCRPSRRSSASPTTRSSTLGVQDLDSTATIADAADRAPRRRPRRSATTRRCCSATSSQPAQRGRHERHQPALHRSSPRPQGPEQRGRPVLGAGQRGRPGRPRTTSCTATRTRTRPRRARRRSARPATSPSSSASRSSATCPGNQAARPTTDDAAALMTRPSPRSRRAQRVPRKDRPGANPFVGRPRSCSSSCVIGVYFGFTKHVPFTHGFRVKAVFQSAQLDPRRTRRCASPA